MNAPRNPACEWVGLAADAEHEGTCGRPANAVIFDSFGARHFACRDHLASVKAHFGTGSMVLRTGGISARPYPEAIP